MYWDLCNGILAYGNLLHSNSTVCNEKPAFFINHWTEWANVPMFIAMSNYWRVYYLYIIYMGTGSVFSDIMGIFHWACQVWFGSQIGGLPRPLWMAGWTSKSSIKCGVKRMGPVLWFQISYIYIHTVQYTYIYIHIHIYIYYIVNLFFKMMILADRYFWDNHFPIDKHL